MKKIATILLLLSFHVGFAQNWSVISPSEDTLNFKSSAEYVFSLVTDSVVNGTNSTLIYPEAALDIDSFYMPDVGKVSGDSWLGNVIIENGNEIIFKFKTDSLILPLNYTTATCVVEGVPLIISKDSTVYQTLPALGVQDSVMYFHIETNSTSLEGNCLNQSVVALTRQNGLLIFPVCLTQLHRGMLYKEIVGSVSRTNFTFLKINDFFNYSVGDQLQYKNASNPFGSGDKIYVSRKYLAKQVDSAAASTTYQVFDTTYFYTSHTGPGNPPREIRLKFNYDIEYFFDDKALTAGASLQPYEITDHLEFIYDQMSWCYDLSEKTWMSDMAALGFPGKRGIRLFSEFVKTGDYVQKSSYNSTCTWSSEAYFVEGIGLVKSREWDGSLDVTMVLEYAKINGQTVYGNELPYFDIPENPLSALNIFPNPAKNVLHVDGLKSNEKCTWEIFDLTGRILKSGVLNNTNQIQISELKSGAYILIFEDFKAIRFVKL